MLVLSQAWRPALRSNNSYGLPINFPLQQVTPSSSCTSTIFQTFDLHRCHAQSPFFTVVLPHWAITRHSATDLLSLVMLRATLAILTASALFPTSSLGVHLYGRDISEPLLDSYDYIVVDCGISGLVVTNWLSEIALRTVLCIEAGEA